MNEWSRHERPGHEDDDIKSLMLAGVLSRYYHQPSRHSAGIQPSTATMHATLKASLLSLLATPVFSKTDLIIPLYSQPVSWGSVEAALANAATAHPNLVSKVIVNVDNGPGAAFPPSQEFIDGVRNLSLSNPNTQVIGYVHTSNDRGTTRCSEPLEDVKANITAWARWNTISGESIHGIFVDEAPDGQAATSCLDYMGQLAAHIKTNTSINFVQPRIAVFNPGDPGSGGLPAYYALNPGPDLIVALESCFTTGAHATGFDAVTGDGCTPGNTDATYDGQGINSTITTYLPFDVHPENYPRTAIIVHGFHDDNGNFSATAATLQAEVENVVKTRIGAVLFNSLWYFTYDSTIGPATISNVVAALDTANGQFGQ